MTRSDLLSTTTANFFGFEGIGAFVAVTFVGLFIGRFFLGFIHPKAWPKGRGPRTLWWDWFREINVH
jgi:hypothetical protein